MTKSRLRENAEPLRVGLVGCGGMGNEHLKIIAKIPHACLVGVCDFREDRARRMSDQYGVPGWLEYAQFLDEARPQAVHICSPSGLHAQHGIAAAERSIHVLSEKPLDIDLAKVDKLIETCDRYDVRLGCIFQRRMSRGAQTLQRAIGEGKMGRLIACSVAIKWWRSQAYYDKDAWRGTWELDGGVLANQGIHSLDQMVWMAGPVAEVEYACLQTATHHIEAEDFALAIVRFENGARGSIEATTCCQPDMATRLEIYGTNGSAAIEEEKVTRFGLDGVDLTETLEDTGALTGGGSDPWAISMEGHMAQILDFYSAIAEHRPPVVDGREARPAIDLLSKIYKKAFPNIKVGT